MALRFIRKEESAKTGATIEVNVKVLRVLKAEQISFAALVAMSDKSAITRFRDRNRRYDNCLFRVKDGTVVDMQRFSMAEVGSGKERVMEECELCGGQGCGECGWIGQIIRWITDKEDVRLATIRWAGPDGRRHRKH